MLKKISCLIFSYIFLIITLFAVPQGQGKNDRFTVGHKDMQGNITSATGGGALGTLSIRDTGTTMPSFQDANDDIAVGVFQMNHDKKLSTNMDSVHLHYYLPNAPSAGNTVYFDTYYTWYTDNNVIPAIANWSVVRSTITFTGTEPQYSTGFKVLASNLTYPTNEEYSSILRVKVLRDSSGGGSDTYASDLGIDYIDCHYQSDKVGSFNEATD